MTDESLWDYYQTEAMHVFSACRPRLAYLLNWVQRPATRLPVRVLNIGAGDGTLEALALAQGFTVFSVDPSERAIATLRARLGLGDQARSGRAEALPFPDGSLDAVIVSEVLEHLDNATIDAALNEVHRVLVPGGRLVGSVPARENLSLQQMICPACQHCFHRWGHRQSFTPERLQNVLASQFTVQRIVTRPFYSWEQLNWKGRAIAILHDLLARLGVHSTNESICFLVTK